MKQVQGTAYNISSDIVGRITFGKVNPFSRSKHVLVSKPKRRLGGMLLLYVKNAILKRRMHYALLMTYLALKRVILS